LNWRDLGAATQSGGSGLDGAHGDGGGRKGASEAGVFTVANQFAVGPGAPAIDQRFCGCLPALLDFTSIAELENWLNALAG
jgi:hypothetical protein